MISSCQDLIKFFWALFHNQVFDDQATLDIMKTRPPIDALNHAGSALGHGLHRFDFDGEQLYGHTGCWGVSVFYPLKHDVLVSINWLQQMAEIFFCPLLPKVVSMAANATPHLQ